MEVIYIIHLREFIKSGEEVYKIGRTCNPAQRFGSYPSGSDIIFECRVADSKAIEDAAKFRFRRIFTYMPNYGYEYFKAPRSAIVKAMCFIIIEIDQSRKQLPPPASSETCNSDDSIPPLSVDDGQPIVATITSQDQKHIYYEGRDIDCIAVDIFKTAVAHVGKGWVTKECIRDAISTGASYEARFWRKLKHWLPHVGRMRSTIHITADDGTSSKRIAQPVLRFASTDVEDFKSQWCATYGKEDESFFNTDKKVWHYRN
jgi:hypothetical protein